MLRCAALALVCAALAAAERPRRAEMSPAPFLMGSRYGRSSERVMAPRNDRFFMGSRYGKRSGAGAGAGVEAERGVWEGCEVEGGGFRLVCRYARARRVPHLYWCVRTRDQLPYDRHAGGPGAAAGVAAGGGE